MERVDPELLLTQNRWLRALALRLARPGTADDIVQETWLAALQSKADGRNPAAWLAGVARNLARRARRSEASRPRRERAAARPEALPATDEIVAEGELQRRLIEAVMALDEPQRSTVLLRYFRGLSGEEIARAQGVPSATVRTRLARALARLRESLDREWGSREAWSALALAGGGSALPLAAPLGIGGGVAMGLKAKIVLAVALVLAGAMVWRVRRAPEGDSARGEAAAEAVLEVDSTAVLATPPSSSAPPAELSDVREPTRATPLFAEVLVSGSVLDTAGAPVDEAWVQLEDEQAHTLQGQSSSDGRWAVSGLHPGRWTLSASARGFARVRRELAVPGEVPEQREDIVLEPALTLRIRVLDEQGQALAPYEGGLFLVATQDPPCTGTLGVRMNPNELFCAGSLAASSPDPAESEVPPGCFALLRLGVGLPVHVSLLLGDTIVATELVEAPREELVLRIDRTELMHRLGGVRVRFVDGVSGVPVQGRGMLLQQEAYGKHARGGALTDEEGRVQLEGMPPRLWWLHFVGVDYAYSTRSVRVPEGRIEELGDVPVWPTATLRGRVLDANGDSIEANLQWAPRAEVRHPLDVDALYQLRRGTFELAEVARAPLWLLVSSKDRARQVLAVDASSGLVEGLEIRLAEGTRVVLRHGRESFGRQATIVDANGAPLGSWSLGDRARAVLLAPGRYELLVGSGERVERREPFVVGSEPLLLAVPAPER